MKRSSIKASFAASCSSRICLPEDVDALTRRQLLASGASMVAYLSLGQLLAPGIGSAQASFPVQRKLVWINMRGGWDILEVTDPKIASTSGIDMIYDWGQAHTLAGGDGSVRLGRWLPNIAALGSDVLVIRGLAMGTTSHEAGSMYMDTGILSNAGIVNAASIPAIVASQGASTIPLIQLSGGSDAKTDRGLLNPVSVVRADNLSLYRGMFPSTEAEKDQRLAIFDYVKSSAARLKVEVGVNDRLSRMETAEVKVQRQFADDVGKKLALTPEEIAAYSAGAPADFNRGMADSFALALKLINSDIVDTVNLGVGGFDTHSNQSASLERTLGSVDFLLGKFVAGLKESGKLDSTLIVLYSDFGRTPKINGGNGRDHWPVGGALMIGGGIQGGRVVGGTDDDLRAQWISPTSGAVVTEGTSGAIQLSPVHLGGSILELTLGAGYMKYRDSYLKNIPALTMLKA